MLSTLLWLTLTVYHEARNQDIFDQIAVAHVILNRSAGDSVKRSVLRANQFSCYNNGVMLPTDWPALKTSAYVSLVAIRGVDFTGGATYYHTRSVKPYWRHKVSWVGEFGSHVLYKPMVRLKPERRKIHVM